MPKYFRLRVAKSVKLTPEMRKYFRYIEKIMNKKAEKYLEDLAVYGSAIMEP